MAEPIRVCRADDVVEGMPLRADPHGYPPLAVFRVGEELFVTSNICTHGQALLSEGFQEGTIIECPFHGGQFDIRTGEATAFPCRIALQTYRVSCVNGWVCLGG